jgi:hypothetical protein
LASTLVWPDATLFVKNSSLQMYIEDLLYSETCTGSLI